MNKHRKRSRQFLKAAVCIVSLCFMLFDYSDNAIGGVVKALSNLPRNSVTEVNKKKSHNNSKIIYEIEEKREIDKLEFPN